MVVPVTNGSRLVADAIRDRDAAGLRLDDGALRRPTLDDVFSHSPATPPRTVERTHQSSEEEAPTGERSDKSGTNTAPNQRIAHDPQFRPLPPRCRHCGALTLLGVGSCRGCSPSGA